MEREFSIGGREFKLCKIDAFKQFHIVRRVGPILSDLLPAMKGVKALSPEAVEAIPEEERIEQFEKIAAPLLNGFSKLSDKDSEFVMLSLLQAVEVKQSTGNWARVSNGEMVMMQDLELPFLLQLAGRAFMYNLSSFFGALPQK